ncbi:MAG: hypothetical protein N3B14_08540 [Thermoleophilia bacterium]|nr:hypothetical protein [Thermoleophilia bacterium]
MTQEEYGQQLRAWLDKHASTLDESQFRWLTDPADWKNLDQWDLQLLSEDNRRLHRALDDLKRVKAPRELKAAHEDLAEGFAELVRAYDLCLEAAKEGDLNKLAAGWALRTKSYEQVHTAIAELYRLGKALEQGQEATTTTQRSSPASTTTSAASTIPPTTTSTSISVTGLPAVSLRSFSGPVKHYLNEEYGFGFDYPPAEVYDNDGCDVFEKNPLEMVLEGWAFGVYVQFVPYSQLRFPDYPGALVLVQDPSMPGGNNWGTRPEVLLEMMRLNAGDVWGLYPAERGSAWLDPSLSQFSPVAAVSTRGTELFLQKAGGKVHACAITPTYQYLLYVDEHSFGEPPQDFAEGFLASFYANGAPARRSNVATDEQTYLELAASLTRKLRPILVKLSTLFDEAARSLDEFDPVPVANLNTEWSEVCAQWMRGCGLAIASNSSLLCLDSCLRNTISVLWDYRGTYQEFLGLRSVGPDDQEVYSCLDDVRALLNSADLFIKNAIYIGEELASHLEWQ